MRWPSWLAGVIRWRRWSRSPRRRGSTSVSSRRATGRRCGDPSRVPGRSRQARRGWVAGRWGGRGGGGGGGGGAGGRYNRHGDLHLTVAAGLPDPAAAWTDADGRDPRRAPVLSVGALRDVIDGLTAPVTVDLLGTASFVNCVTAVAQLAAILHPAGMVPAHI